MKNFKELERTIRKQEKLVTELQTKFRQCYNRFKLANPSENGFDGLELMMCNAQIEYHCAEAILESLQEAVKKLQEIEKNL